MQKFWKFVRWLLLGVLVAPRFIGWPTALKQAQESASFWEEVGQWLIAHDLHFWIPALLLAVGFLIVDLKAYWPRWFDRFWHNKELYSKLMQEHDDMRPTRSSFWRAMNLIYTSATPKEPGDPYNRLDDLIAAADPLDSREEGTTLQHWENSLSGASKTLWEFIAWAHYAKDEHVELQDDPFECQRVIANYWNKVGAAIYDEGEISERKVFERHFPHQSRLLKLTLYMERLVELELKSRKLRKPYAFKIYQRAKAVGETYEGAPVQNV